MKKYTTKLLLFSMCLFLASCVATKNDNKAYVLLSANEIFLDYSQGVEMSSDLSIGLMPIKLASHINREGFVQYDEFQQVQYNNTILWAEPLQKNSENVLAEYIAILLTKNGQPTNNNSVGASTNNVDFKLFPWTVKQKPDVTIQLDIIRFGYDVPAKHLTLAGKWSIEAVEKTKKLADSHKTSKNFQYQIDIQEAADQILVNEVNLNEMNHDKKITLAYTKALANLAQDMVLHISQIK